MNGRRLPRSDSESRNSALGDVAWLVAGLAGALWLLALVGVVIGLLLGGPGPTGDPPTIDTADDPTAVLVAAADRLDHRGFTVEEWVRTVDYRDGSVSGGRFFRFDVERPRGQLRGEIRPAGPYSDHGFVGDEPVAELFVADGAAWVRLRESSYWQRSAPAANLTTQLLAPLNLSRERLADADLSVVASNESTWIGELPIAQAPGVDGGVGTVRYVVALGEDPHLQEVRIHRPGRQESSTRLLRIVRYGQARAIRPADVPWTTVSELQRRAARGLDRLDKLR